MNMMNSLMRLGAAIFGTNEQLAPMPEDTESGDGSGESSEDTDSESEDTDSESEDTESEDTESEDTESEDTESEDTESEDTDSESADDSDADDSDADDSDADDSDADSDSDDSDADSDSDDSDSDDSDSDGESADSDGESADSDGESADSDGDDEGDDTEGESADSDSDSDSDSDDSDAGGFEDLDDLHDKILASLKDIESTDLLDAHEALAAATDKCREDDCRENEQVWRPYDTEKDEIIVPKVTDERRKTADAYHKQVKPLTAAFRSAFRRRFLAAREKNVLHGVRRGKDLSERRLVESFIEIKSGARASRPDYIVEERPETTIAVAVVGDESGSMYGESCIAAAMAMMSMAEAFDTLGCPVMCCGPRNGRRASSHWQDKQAADAMGMTIEDTLYHRHDSVRIDLFKDWDQSFKQAKPNFAAYTATGSTPLEDGVQFALQEMSVRPERHRIIVVLTDGEPDHPEVVRRQIRLAAEAGITVIGVGIDVGEYFVPRLFPDNHVVVKKLAALPKAMLTAVEAIVFPKTAKKAKVDGTLGRKRRRSA